MPARMQEIENRCARPPDVEETRGRRSKTKLHDRGGSLTSLQSPDPMKRQRGFSLVELLFALLILTIVIMTSLAMFVERTNRSQQASELILAYQAISNETEVKRRIDYRNLDALTDDFSTDTTILEPLRPFTTEVDVTLQRPGIKRVKMTIRWRADREATVTLIRSDTGGTNLW